MIVAKSSARSDGHRVRAVAFVVAAVVASFLVVLLAGGCGSSSTGSSSSTSPTATSSATALDTLTPGVLLEALEPYMPYTGETKPGVVDGLDGQIITAAANKLGLKVKYVVTDFPGMLASVQSHRVDIAYGGTAWTAKRAQVGLFTDAYYYSPQTLTTLKGKPVFLTLASIKGKTIGTMTGTVQGPAIQAAGAHLVVQPTVAGLLAQLTEGRIDAAVIDPLLAAYTAKQRPDLKLVNTTMQAPTAAQVKAASDLAGFLPYSVAAYIPKQEPKLEAALSAQIDQMYKDGELSALMAKWGVDPKVWLTPYATAASERAGVDRPAGWTPPGL
jgi:ABC-type amino acid transport substrate-binding protein